MIRQAHTYLVGALSGVVVIAIAIGAFVVLVSAQVFHDLPIPALSSSDQKAALSSGKAVSSPGDQAVASTGGVSVGTGQPNHTAGIRAAGQNGATNAQPTGGHQGNTATPTHDATAPAEVVATSPTAGGGESSTSTGGGNSGSHANQPSSSSPPPSNSSTPSTGGGGSGGGGGGSNSSSGSSGSGSGGSNSSTGTSGSGTTTTGNSGGSTTPPPPPPSTPVTTAKPSEVITETVNKTVGGVDEALGGTLGETGVTHVTEEAVNGVAGPESVVGKTVDGVGEVVNGLLGKGE